MDDDTMGKILIAVIKKFYYYFFIICYNHPPLKLNCSCAAKYLIIISGVAWQEIIFHVKVL